ncbi:sensor histidine kinase [Fodinibacter luteus]
MVGDLPPLPAAVEVAAFHVVREALSNAVKHAHADRIVVEVQTVGDRLRAEVRDDGNGTVSPRQDGVGLTSMRERAEELGGDFAITSDPTRGTTVRLELPTAGGAAAKVGRP